MNKTFPETHTKFKLGDQVSKICGSAWRGRMAGWYSTNLTPEGYAIESVYERGSVQIYPTSALELRPLSHPEPTRVGIVIPV